VTIIAGAKIDEILAPFNHGFHSRVTSVFSPESGGRQRDAPRKQKENRFLVQDHATLLEDCVCKEQLR
jgi:hypothetical protein